MTTLIAMLALVVAHVAISVAYFWFGFGLWPTNWTAVVGYGVFGTALVRVLGEKAYDEWRTKK